MSDYRYVVISDDGRSWLLEGDQLYDQSTDHNQVLPRMMNDGWEPVRERRLGNTVLVLMGKYEAQEHFTGSGNDIPF